jgi:hypothetical protein
MKRLILFLLLIVSRQGIGQTYVLIPDPTFAAYLQSVVPTAMSNNSLDVTNPLVTTSTQTINVNSMGISNLQGIQFFTSLKTLLCPNNLLTNLPSLPNSLKELQCYNNSLTNLPGLPGSLQVLHCQNNSLTGLPVLPNSLGVLACSNNSLVSLPILSSSLVSLTCSNNSLSSLPALNTLANLTCDGNNIHCFPTFPNSLNVVIIHNNPFNCLPNYILPAMNMYTSTPLCSPGNSNNCAVGFKELSILKDQVLVYPNPADKQFTVETISGKKQTIQLSDIHGRLLLEEIASENVTFETTLLNCGIYNLAIKTSDKTLNKKIVIVHGL